MKNLASNPPNGSFGFNVPLAHRIFDFYKLFYNYLYLFPNKDKHTLDRKIENLILDLLECVFSAATETEEKRKLLKKASLNVDLLKILIRLCKEVKILDDKKYLKLQKELQEIGKMVGGWIKSLNK